jgi:hypothetical protein
MDQEHAVGRGMNVEFDCVGAQLSRAPEGFQRILHGVT